MVVCRWQQASAVSPSTRGASCVADAVLGSSFLPAQAVEEQFSEGEIEAGDSFGGVESMMFSPSPVPVQVSAARRIRDDAEEEEDAELSLMSPSVLTRSTQVIAKEVMAKLEAFCLDVTINEGEKEADNSFGGVDGVLSSPPSPVPAPLPHFSPSPVSAPASAKHSSPGLQHGNIVDRSAPSGNGDGGPLRMQTPRSGFSIVPENQVNKTAEANIVDESLRATSFVSEVEIDFEPRSPCSAGGNFLAQAATPHGGLGLCNSALLEEQRSDEVEAQLARTRNSLRISRHRVVQLGGKLALSLNENKSALVKIDQLVAEGKNTNSKLQNLKKILLGAESKFVDTERRLIEVEREKNEALASVAGLGELVSQLENDKEKLNIAMGELASRLRDACAARDHALKERSEALEELVKARTDVEKAKALLASAVDTQNDIDRRLMDAVDDADNLNRKRLHGAICEIVQLTGQTKSAKADAAALTTEGAMKGDRIYDLETSVAEKKASVNTWRRLAAFFLFALVLAVWCFRAALFKASAGALEELAFAHKELDASQALLLEVSAERVVAEKQAKSSALLIAKLVYELNEALKAKDAALVSAEKLRKSLAASSASATAVFAENQQANEKIRNLTASMEEASKLVSQLMIEKEELTNAISDLLGHSNQPLWSIWLSEALDPDVLLDNTLM